MGSKLQKNAIMKGYINSYCLVCECYFDTDEDTSFHIQDTGHADKLLAFPYLEKYGDNHIRKVNCGYFCEFCSILLATAAKVSLHVQERVHYEKKGTFLLRRPSGVSAVIAFDDLLLGERAWHSLSEDTCAICNEEFDNENIHKTESSHLLKLVQNKVEFGPGNTVYRKTDDSSFQCLTCNAVFAVNTLNDHFTDAEHKKLYANCQGEYKKYREQSKLKATEKPKDEAKDKINDVKNKKDNVVNKKDDIKIKKDDVKDKIDETKDRKDEKKPVDNNHNEVKNPKIQTEVKTRDCGCKEIVRTTVSTNPEPENEETVYANSNNLTYNAGNTNAFCRVCETKLPATLRSMKEHVNGKEHKNRLGRLNSASQAAKAKSNIITKKPMEKFIQYCVNIENMFHQDVVINERYCIPLPSFMMLTRVGGRFRCQACEMTVFEGDLGEHMDLPRHERALQTTPVITSLPDSEFVREVRPNIYHCGFCNQIVPRWEEVASHLQSREHRDNKDECSWRLQRHLPQVLLHRRREEMDVFRMIMMGQMFRH